MANLTLVIDDDVLRRARIKALEHGTSVNAVVRQQLENYVASNQAQQAMAEVLTIARRSGSGSGPAGRSWTREQLYDDRVPER